MSQLLRIRPTKIELIRLRRRLSLSNRVQKILSERLTILVNEFLVVLRDAIEKRTRIQESLRGVYNNAALNMGIYGPSLKNYLREISPKPVIYIGTENIMGVKVKTVISKYEEKPIETLPTMQEFIKQSQLLIQDLVELAKLERSLIEIGREVARTKRKVNALQYVVIPNISMQIKHLQLKFDEREREEKARLKRIKQVLSRRTQH